MTENLDYRGKFLDWQEHAVFGPGEIYLPVPPGDILAVATRKETCWNLLNGFLEAGDGIQIDLPSGDWHIGICVKRTFTGKEPIFQPDYLSSTAMKAFFSTTLDAYEKAVGEYFGNTIPGVFTDEPTIVAWHQDHPDTMMKHHDSAIAAWGSELERSLRDAG